MNHSFEFQYLPAIINKQEETIEIIDKIGSGGSSDVFVGKILDSQIKVAVKLFHLKSKEFKVQDLEYCRNEVQILESLSNNPRVCKLFYSSEIEKNNKYIFYLVLELGETTLSSLIRKNKKFTKEEIEHFFEEMIIVFSDLENLGIFYRDIKPQNIIVFPNNQYKLIDFDVSDNLSLLTKKLKNGKELKIDLKGTPRYFSPELKNIFLKFNPKDNKKLENKECSLKIRIKKNNKKIKKLENEKLITFGIKKLQNLNLNDKFNKERKSSASMDLIKSDNESSEEETTIRQNKKQIIVSNKDLTTALSLKIFCCTLSQINTQIKATDCFKHDVFSLGMILFQMVEINIEELNENEELLADAVKRFKIKQENSKCSKYIDKMVCWSIKERLDFKEILDSFIYSDNLNINLLSKNKKNSEDFKFTSLRAINQIWWDGDVNILKYHYFSSNARISLKVPKEFIINIIDSIEKKNILYFLKKELEENFFNSNNEFIKNNSQETKILIYDFLKLEKEKNKKHQKHFNNTFIKIYSLESFFVYELNLFLSNNEVEKCKYFYSIFIKKRKIIDENIEYLYRILIINPSEDNFTIRNQYLINSVYYWPCFTSTSLDEKSVFNFMKKKLSYDQILSKELILFEIKVHKEKKNNKVNMLKSSLFPEEKEILLLPYFHFKVIESEVETINIFNSKKNICKIKIEEINKNIIDINIVWIDPAVNNLENKQYQNIIREINENLYVFNNIDEALQFINENDKYSLIISSGNIIEILLQTIKNNDLVLNVILFTNDDNKYIQLIDKYEKCKTICKTFTKLLYFIPKKKTIY